ncbi:YoaK family protein [Sphingomonas sp. SUN039]|uniref:YoaK family protein n=1 Tax=Sphingomonas sp. SUN039 TaxID=2937787 RepID=UPI0021648448|nr:YoaK family protein [Sphingomonas sp. SUN039]UVO55137.1 YoaK family protein [Sphingomonas sp. SUN039]
MTRYDQRTRALAASLAAVAGYVDATGFLASKGFFVSFMSGNSTRLAVGTVERAADAAAALVLIAVFVVGVVTGSLVGRRAGRHQRSIVIAFVAVSLVSAMVLSSLGQLHVALGLMALAMGAENAIFEAEGEVQIGLTYMTGTLVKFGQRLGTALSGGDRWSWVPYAMLWLGLVAGAVLGAALFPVFGLASLLLPAALLAVLALLVRRLGLEG